MTATEQSEFELLVAAERELAAREARELELERERERSEQFFLRREQEAARDLVFAI